MNRLENELRKAKETKLVAEESGNQELIGKMQNRERLLASKYHKLSKASGLPTRGDKIRAMVTQQPQPSMAVMKNEPVIVVKHLPEQYKDVTNEWLKNATPNNHKVVIDKKYIDSNGVKHPIKGKENAHKTPKDSDEYRTSLWLEKTFGGYVHNVPRITDASNTGLSVFTPDYIWNKVKWDLKTPGINGKFENTLSRFLKDPKAKKQAKSYIIDYANFPDKTNAEISSVVENTLRNRDWVDNLIVKRGENLIKIYSKK